MSNNPLVSILINCFNAENFIESSLLSAINQSYKNIEIIVWDNSSTDNTAMIINRVKDDRVKYFKNSNHVTLGEARVEAIKHLNGEFIAILDADDLAYEDRIAKQLQIFLDNKEIGLVSGWMNIINNKSKVINSYEPTFSKYNMYEQLCWSNPIVHSSIMYRQSVAHKLKWYSLKITNFQDYHLTLKISLNYKVFNLSNVIGAKRIHESNSIKNNDTYLKQIKDYKLLLRYISFYIPPKKKFLKKMNQNSIKVSNLKIILFELSKNFNFKNIYKIIKFIINNPIVIFHNGYVRKFLIKI